MGDTMGQYKIYQYLGVSISLNLAHTYLENNENEFHISCIVVADTEKFYTVELIIRRHTDAIEITFGEAELSPSHLFICESVLNKYLTSMDLSTLVLKIKNFFDEESQFDYYEYEHYYQPRYEFLNKILHG
jgi:hypothetical protein